MDNQDTNSKIMNTENRPARLELNKNDIDKKIAFCRCWKSKKFPYCDGAHREHNEKCGDCVGPLVVMVS